MFGFSNSIFYMFQTFEFLCVALLLKYDKFKLTYIF